jgi:hypothetical protein
MRREEKQPQQQRHKGAIDPADKRRFHGVDPAGEGELRYGQGVVHASYVLFLFSLSRCA